MNDRPLRVIFDCNIFFQAYLTPDHSVEARQFRQLTQNRIKMLTPVAFLAEMARSGS